MFYDKRQKAEQAKLVWCRHDHATARFSHAYKLSHKRSRIFQMLDSLHGYHCIRAPIRQRCPAPIKVNLVEVSIFRKTLIADDIDSGVALKTIPHERQKTSFSTTNINNQLTTTLS